MTLIGAMSHTVLGALVVGWVAPFEADAPRLSKCCAGPRKPSPSACCALMNSSLRASKL